MYLNKVLLIGNLTRDPEKRALPNGTNVTSFSLATNRIYKDKNGAKQESVEYHNVVTFSKLAELCAQYLKRGQSAYVEGRLQTRSWDDKATNQKKYRTEIVADTVQFGQKAGGSPSTPMPGGAGVPTSPQANVGKEALDTIEYPEEESNVEDIPF
ncbi:MAG: single-stranded DNA-binding protein [Candidatus Paceibacterota bacterium]|jgi:single-strand DNA-binding protein